MLIRPLYCMRTLLVLTDHISLLVHHDGQIFEDFIDVCDVRLKTKSYKEVIKINKNKKNMTTSTFSIMSKMYLFLT